MKFPSLTVLAVFAVALPFSALAGTQIDLAPRLVLPFDSNWAFTKSDDVNSEPKGAEAADFDDSQWRIVNSPHDWSIEGPYDEKSPVGYGGGYLPAGVAWYRKTFMLPAGD
ncbi:MAG: glycoside hydrolase family 2, partial [Opitutales bacterium]